MSELCSGNLHDFVIGKFKGQSALSIHTIMLQIVHGLKYLHLMKITHGDLIPTIILISLPKGDLYPAVKLSDFGLHHALVNELGSDNREKQFVPAFTKGWICPTDAVDEKGLRRPSFDIFPLGLILGFTASGGIHPFGRDLDEAIDRIGKKRDVKLSFTQLDESVRSVAFMELLTKMLSYDQTKRPAASEILDHLLIEMQPVMGAQPQEKTPYVEPVMPLPSLASSRSHVGKSPAKKLRSASFGEGSNVLDQGIMGSIELNVFEAMQQTDKYVS